MTDRPALHDYGASRAVLIGTAGYKHLPALPAARNSLHRMRRLLTGELCGWPDAQVTVLYDRDSRGLSDQLITLYEHATDVALFYFVGHGQIADVDYGTELCLGTVDSREDPHRRESTALTFRAVRNALLNSRAATKIVILDCCYAGLAAGNVLGAARTVPSTVRVSGSYLIAASGADSEARYQTDTDTPLTYLTKYFADAVEAGIADAGERLNLHSVFLQVHTRLTAEGLPPPIDRGVDAGRTFDFAHNRAFPTPSLQHVMEPARPGAAGPGASPAPADIADRTQERPVADPPHSTGTARAALAREAAASGEAPLAAVSVYADPRPSTTADSGKIAAFNPPVTARRMGCAAPLAQLAISTAFYFIVVNLSRFNPFPHALFLVLLVLLALAAVVITLRVRQGTAERRRRR